MIDPEIMLGLHNSNQNRTSINLQEEILAMQKLQVLNQVRMSQGLAPLTQLPKETEEPNYYGITVLAVIFISVLLGLVVVVVSRQQDQAIAKFNREYDNRQLERQEREEKEKTPPPFTLGGGNK